MKHIFLTRNFAPTMRSMLKIKSTLPWILSVTNLNAKTVLERLPCPYEDKSWSNIRNHWLKNKAQDKNTVLIYALYFAAATDCCRKYIKHLDGIVIYEDLMSDVEGKLQVMLQLHKIISLAILR